MEQKSDSYSIKELCKRADVTSRTIRFYIEEGLLPPPEGPKSQSRYNQAHLQRLQIIRQLKNQYWPLREIKKTLENKSPVELSKLAQQIDFKLTSRETKEQKEMSKISTRPATSQVLPMPPLTKRQTEKSATSLGFHLGTANLGFTFPGLYNKEQPEYRPTIIEEIAPASNVWERITIAPGVELNVETEIANKNRDVLDELIKEIRRKLK